MGGARLGTTGNIKRTPRNRGTGLISSPYIRKVTSRVKLRLTDFWQMIEPKIKVEVATKLRRSLDGALH